MHYEIKKVIEDDLKIIEKLELKVRRIQARLISIPITFFVGMINSLNYSRLKIVSM